MSLAPDAQGDNRRLHQLLRLTVAAGGIYLWLQSPLESMSIKVTGTAMFLLAFLPILRWAGQGRAWFPAFEIMMLTSAVFYAVPLLNGHPATLLMPHAILLQAGLGVLIYQGAAIIAFESMRRYVRAPYWFTESLFPGRVGHLSQIGLWLNTLYLYAAYFTEWIPWEYSSIVRAGAFGVGIVSAFVQGRLYGDGELSPGEKFVFILNICAQSIMMLTGLYLIQVLGLVAIALIGRISASRSLPILPLVIMLPIAAVLHTGKPAMRAVYWTEEAARPTLTQLPAFFGEWVQFAFDAKANEEAELGMGSRIAERASLFHMLGYVMMRVPALDPYLDGETYMDIPAQIIPRIIWPGKPAPHLSNVRLAIYFGFVTEENASRVSIAFGIPTEAYANFGLLGMGLIGALLGLVYKTAALMSANQPIFSAAGLTMIILTAWSFQAELVLATWFSSAFQACIMVVGLPLVARHFGLLGR